MQLSDDSVLFLGFVQCLPLKVQSRKVFLGCSTPVITAPASTRMDLARSYNLHGRQMAPDTTCICTVTEEKYRWFVCLFT